MRTLRTLRTLLAFRTLRTLRTWRPQSRRALWTLRAGRSLGTRRTRLGVGGGGDGNRRNERHDGRPPQLPQQRATVRGFGRLVHLQEAGVIELPECLLHHGDVGLDAKGCRGRDVDLLDRALPVAEAPDGGRPRIQGVGPLPFKIVDHELIVQFFDLESCRSSLR